MNHHVIAGLGNGDIAVIRAEQERIKQEIASIQADLVRLQQWIETLSLAAFLALCGGVLLGFTLAR